MATSSESSTGIGLSECVGVVFIVLKLIGVIDWPWIWVLAPIWIPLAAALLIVAFAALIVGMLK